MSDLRKRFEAWYRTLPGFKEHLLAVDGWYPDYYGNPCAQCSWSGYKAGQADGSGPVSHAVETSRDDSTDVGNGRDK